MIQSGWSLDTVLDWNGATSLTLTNIAHQDDVFFTESPTKLFRTDGTTVSAVADNLNGGVAGGATLGNRLVVVDLEGGLWVGDAAGRRAASA